MIGELAKTPAFNALFGRLISGSEAKPGIGKRVFNHILETFGETEGANYENMKSHTVPGKHLELSDVLSEHTCRKMLRVTLMPLFFRKWD